LADWPNRATQGQPMVDPMCGSGTLVLEAAEMAMGRAPGLRRTHWGFANWLGHRTAVWRDLVEEALQAEHPSEAVVFASDIDLGAVRATRHNATQLGLQDLRVQQRDVRQLAVPDTREGLFLTNPPYGARLGNEEDLIPFYKGLGDLMKTHLNGWDAYVFCPANTLSKSIGLKTQRRIPLMNGPIDCRLLHFPIRAKVQQS